MIRSDLETGSPHVSATVHGDGLTSLQYRTVGRHRNLRAQVIRDSP
ncbi:MAG: hypothetical protein MZV63_60940 [Marinilabiliales bacterium]|nr:hypothetical protein [Marinilabiliales bacterium]